MPPRSSLAGMSRCIFTEACPSLQNNSKEGTAAQLVSHDLLETVDRGRGRRKLKMDGGEMSGEERESK